MKKKNLFFSSRRPVDTGAAETDAQKKFGGAKAISSDMYFGNGANVSLDYFGPQKEEGVGRAGSY